jgi:hypothetical protein
VSTLAAFPWRALLVLWAVFLVGFLLGAWWAGHPR